MSHVETPRENRSSRRALQERRRAERGQRRRKIQALAAGGLVLGVGASATLAAWTDKAMSTGQFTAGQFAIEANTGSDWNSTDEMQFENAPMAPGQSVYASVALRSSVNTTVDGEVTVHGKGTAQGLAPYLQFRAVTVKSAGAEFKCSAEAFDFGDYVVGSETEYVAMSGDATAHTTQHLAAQQAATITYCFEVQLDPAASNETQKLTADYTWKFHAQSIIPN